MSVTAFTRLRMLWGGFDWQHGTDHPYSTSQTVTGGTSAVASGGIGVRRCAITIDRASQHGGADAALMHFSVLNMTSGAPDDTWTSTDYTQAETAISAFFSSMATYWPTGYKVTIYNWYREGDGVVKPNPAERQTVLTTPIAGSGSGHLEAPQVATTITFRTGVRHSWGRTYFPAVNLTGNNSGNITSGNVDAIAGYAQTMVNSLASNDLHLVVVSKPLHASLNVEHVEVDDNFDIVRRRRWKSSTYKKILP